MRRPDTSAVRAAARASGFADDSLEIVFAMLAVLREFRRSRVLDERLRLKGGTALNLFHLDTRRLSVDIDVDYVSDADELTDDERETVGRAVERACKSAGLNTQGPRVSHAGWSWRPSFVSGITHRRTHVKIDLTWTWRVPIWPAERREAAGLAGLPATSATLVSREELVAGKVCALLERAEARDFFDAGGLTHVAVSPERRDIALAVHLAARRADVLAGDTELCLNASDVEARLRPVIARSSVSVSDLANTLVENRRQLLDAVLPLPEPHREFVRRVQSRGDIASELLTDASDLQARIARIPHLRFKADNVRTHVQRGEQQGP